MCTTVCTDDSNDGNCNEGYDKDNICSNNDVEILYRKKIKYTDCRQLIYFLNSYFR